MPANGTIVLADGESTPVDHTFSPMRVRGDEASYANLSTTFVDGRETLRLNSVVKPKLREVTTTLIVPRVLSESINGVTVDRVADFMTVKCVALVPKTWDEADITNGRVLAANALQNAIVVAAVDRGEGVW
jgi:hypothetical protein